jgi:hypothetical protein
VDMDPAIGIDIGFKATGRSTGVVIIHRTTGGPPLRAPKFIPSASRSVSDLANLKLFLYVNCCRDVG